MTVILPCGLFLLFLYNIFLPQAEFNYFLKEIVLVMRNCCITMSEIELVFRRAQFRCSGSLYSNTFAWIEISLWRSKRYHERSMVKFVSTRVSNTSYMRVHYWTSVSLRRLYFDQFPSPYFKDWDEGFVSNGSKDVLHDKKNIFMHHGITKWVYDLCFVLFCFHLGRICDVCFSQKGWKSFYS